MKRWHVFFISFLLISTLSRAQVATISGLVTDEKHQPLADVSVHVLNTNTVVFTKKDGSFALPQLRTTNAGYTLIFEAAGFATAEKTFTGSDAGNVANITLQSAVNELSEVTVTAEKRENNLQQVPLAVSALTAKQVKDYRLWNSNELTAIIPDLYADNPGDGRNVTSIRGIVTTSYDPAVATYIDGVNQFSLDTYIPTLSDIERVEVLRGPQGTLYGRNALAGVINIITKQPTNEVSEFAEVNAGNYGLQRYNVGLRVPLIKDKLYAGASLLYSRQNGYYTNDVTNSSFDKQHMLYGNYYVKFLPAQNWMVTANVKHRENRNNGAFPLVNGAADALAHPFHLSQDAGAKMIDNTFNSSLVIGYTGSKVNFSSISAYQDNYRYYNAMLDADFSPADIVTIYNNYGNRFNKVNVFTQELRLSSGHAKQKLQYTAGAYYFHQNNPVKQATHYGKDAGIYQVPDVDFSTISTSGSKGDGVALYGQLEFAFTTRLKLTAGIRYDDERRTLSVKEEYQKDGEEVLTTVPDTAAKVTFHAFSPKASIQYVLSAQNNLYGTYSRGYRVGGLSPLNGDLTAPVGLSAYYPENSNNYEIGSKNTFFNNRLRINLAAFATYINNAQVPTLVLPEAITIIKNTGKLKTRGLEAEVSASPAKGWLIDYNAGILHTRYKSLKISQNRTEVNLDGKKQIYTPSATSMLAMQYSIATGKETKLLLRGEWQYRGNLYFDFANTIEQKAYSLLHARAGFEAKYFGIYVWCRNMLDKKYIAYAYDFGAVHLGDPRTFGVTLNTRF